MDHHPATSGQTGNTAHQVVLRSTLPFLSGEITTEDLVGELAFDPADPYAVSMRLQARAGSVTWSFARDLLAEGVFEPAGAGDVQIWPCLSNTGEAVIVIELSSPDGNALLQTPSRAVLEFVTASYDLVAAGEESARIDLDDLVGRLLAD